MTAWTAPGRLHVETITLSATDGQDGNWLRVTRSKPRNEGRLFVGQVRTPAELAGLGVDLASLAEVTR